MRYILSLCVLFLSLGSSRAIAAEKPPPNIILILADDLGYGDLGCYGNRVIRTPNLDRMAREGARFTDFYANGPYCTPTRAGLLSGRYAPRNGLTRVLFPDSKDGIGADETLIAQVLRQRGYATALFGKWHLGHHPEHMPRRFGFQEYFGILWPNDQDDTHFMGKKRGWGPIPVYQNEKVVEKRLTQETFTKKLTEETLAFIAKNKDKPFFAFVSYSQPHRWLAASEKFRGKSNHGLYGDAVEELDWSIGEILNALREHKLDGNTLVFFSSDNGPAPESPNLPDPGGFRGSAGPLRGHKGNTFEGGVRVPGLFWRPGFVKVAEVKAPAIMLDLFPTCVALSGAKPPAGRVIDGKDLSALLQGKGKREGEEFFFFKAEKLEAMRLGKWKLKLPEPPRPKAPKKEDREGHELLLIDLESDIGEKKNVAEMHPEVVKKMRARMEEFVQSLGQVPRPKM